MFCFSGYFDLTPVLTPSIKGYWDTVICRARWGGGTPYTFQLEVRVYIIF